MRNKSPLAYFLLAVTFLFPLFFFPFLRDAFVLSKNFFLIIVTLIALILWLIELWQKGKVEVYLGRLDSFFLLICLFLGSYLFFLPAGNRYEALLGQPGTGTVWLLSLLFFLYRQAFGEEKEGALIKPLVFSAALIALITSILFILPESRFPLVLGGSNSLLAISDPLWSPSGSVLESLWLLIPILAYLVFRLVKQVNREGKIRNWLDFVLAVVILVGLAAGTYQLVQVQFPWLGYRSSWAIAAEGFKRQPFFGLGPGRFSEAFTLYKPNAFNLSSWWNTYFNRPSGFFFQWWTETGIVGLLLLAWLFWRLTRKVKEGNFVFKFSWYLFLLLTFFLPGGLIFWFLLFFLASLIEKGKLVSVPYPNLSLKIVSGLIALIVLVIGYFSYRSFSSEYLFFRFVRGIATGQAQDQDYYTAVNKNPYVSSFRLFRSQVDMAALNNLLAQAAEKGEDLDEDAQRQLEFIVQEAIAEAKAAVALRPQNVIGWENLASTYRQLINLAQGSDQWTISAYLQAIALDPVNPRLRIDLGGVYYGLGDFESAARQFEIAANLKNDYANAWYNWAWALKQQTKLAGAVQALQQAVFLVPVDTADHQQAQSLLEEWREELGKAAVVPGEETEEPAELIPPQPLPSPAIEEPIELPKEAAPDLEISPEPEEPTPAPEEE